MADHPPPEGTRFGERESGVGRFFALVFLLTVPFWLVGGRIGGALLPGVPIAALAVVCPALAAGVVTRGRLPPLGRVSVGTLAVLLSIHPLLALGQFAIVRALGTALPPPDLLPAPFLAALFLVAALLEEIGWTGIAQARLLPRLGVLGAGLIIGAAWSAWHFPALVQAGRGTGWIAWWALGTVALRVLMVWSYAHLSRSVMAMAVLHAMSNLCWQLYPVQGSLYDQRIGAILLAGLAAALLIGTAASAGPAPHIRGR